MYIIDNGNQQWTNLHRTIVNLPIKLKTLYNPPITNLASLKPLCIELEELIDSESGRIRAYGARWSLSSAASADSNGVMLEMANLNQVFRMHAYLESNYSGSADRIRLFQSGISVRALNDFLNARGYALKTSGASDGQTLAGAVSTGTHGAAFQVGAMQESVVGLHIICGKGKNYWIERETYPVVNQQFLDALGATAIRNDDVFNAALVSFGSFGVILAHAVEYDVIYNLEMYRERVSHDVAKVFMEQLFAPDLSLNSNAITTIFQGITKSPTDAHHIEVDINPHDATASFISVMYKTQDMTEVPFCNPSGVPGNESITVVGKTVSILGDVFGNWLTGVLIPQFSGTITSQIQICKPFVRLPRGKMFDPTFATGGILSVELGINLTNISSTVDVLLALNSTIPFAGVFAIRFVKQTQAILGFTKFPMTCCIELPGVGCDATYEFYNNLYPALEAAGIEFTLHWGQMNDYDTNGAAKVRSRWGDAAVNSWLAVRENLLDTPALRDRFSNQLVENCGLNTTVPPAAILNVIAGVIDE